MYMNMYIHLNRILCNISVDQLNIYLYTGTLLIQCTCTVLHVCMYSQVDFNGIRARSEAEQRREREREERRQRINKERINKVLKEIEGKN